MFHDVCLSDLQDLDSLNWNNSFFFSASHSSDGIKGTSSSTWSPVNVENLVGISRSRDLLSSAGDDDGLLNLLSRRDMQK